MDSGTSHPVEQRPPFAHRPRVGDVVAEWACPVCDRSIAVIRRPGRPRLYCSDACRQRAYRWRQRHRAHLVIAPGQRVPNGHAGGVYGGSYHALRTPLDPLSRRKDHRGRQVTVCGALARTSFTVPSSWPPYAGYRPDLSTSCRSCAALTVPRPLGLVPPGAFTPRPDPKQPLDPPDVLLRELLDRIVRQRVAAYRPAA